MHSLLGYMAKSLHSVVSVLCSLCGAGLDDLSGDLYIDRQRRAFLCRLCGCRRARLSGKEPAAGGARRFGRCLSDDAGAGDGILRKRNTSIFLMLFFYTFGSGHAILKLDEKNSGNLHRFNIGMNISLRLSWHNTNVKYV